VFVENDANSAAWAERVYGAGKGQENVIMVTVGTGLVAQLLLMANRYVVLMELALNLDICESFQMANYADVAFVDVTSNMRQELH
jgi:hypothetical protein